MGSLKLDGKAVQNSNPVGRQSFSNGITVGQAAAGSVQPGAIAERLALRSTTRRAARPRLLMARHKYLPGMNWAAALSNRRPNLCPIPVQGHWTSVRARGLGGCAPVIYAGTHNLGTHSSWPNLTNGKDFGLQRVPNLGAAGTRYPPEPEKTGDFSCAQGQQQVAGQVASRYPVGTNGYRVGTRGDFRRAPRATAAGRQQGAGTARRSASPPPLAPPGRHHHGEGAR